MRRAISMGAESCGPPPPSRRPTGRFLISGARTIGGRGSTRSLWGRRILRLPCPIFRRGCGILPMESIQGEGRATPPIRGSRILRRAILRWPMGCILLVQRGMRILPRALFRGPRGRHLLVQCGMRRRLRAFFRAPRGFHPLAPLCGVRRLPRARFRGPRCCHLSPQWAMIR